MATISLEDLLKYSGLQKALQKAVMKQYAAPTVARMMDLEAQLKLEEYQAEQERAKSRIVCPTCQAVVGQREKDGTEIVQWEHAGPCGAQCAGKKLRKWLANGAKRKKYASLHTARMCPRCKPKKCPACLGQCNCAACKGDAMVPTAYGVDRCPCGFPKDGIRRTHGVAAYIPIECKHNCQRCGGKGKVHGLEAE